MENNEKMTEDFELKSTAFHEAGHAIAAYRFNHGCGTVTILATEELAGSSLSEPEWPDGSTDIEQIIVLYAGYAAQKRFDPNADRLGSSSDDDAASELLKFTNETESDLRQRADAVVEKDWEIIKIIAEKLTQYKTLSVDEWTTIIDLCDEGKDPNAEFEMIRQRVEYHNMHHTINGMVLQDQPTVQ